MEIPLKDKSTPPSKLTLSDTDIVSAPSVSRRSLLGTLSAEPPFPAVSTSPAVNVNLVPFGAENIRVTYFPLAVAEGKRVIDAALAAGIKLPYSCKGGMCCTCRAKLVEGNVTMDRNFSLEAWERDAGFVLTCQARPTTPRVLLDYDQV